MPTQPNSVGPSEAAVESIKEFRKAIDAQIITAENILGLNETKGTSTELEIRNAAAREVSLVRTKLQEAKMWAGKVLEVLGNPFPAELADKASPNTSLNAPGGPGAGVEIAQDGVSVAR